VTSSKHRPPRAQPRPSRPAIAHAPKGTVVVSEGAATAVVRGHPWVFREQVRAGLDRVEMGDEVTIAGPTGAPIARGLADPTGPLAVRAWSRDVGARIVDATIAARIEAAVALRDVLDLGDTDAVRWVHGEGDRAPGIVVDRYAHVAVVRLDGPAIETHREAIVRAVAKAASPRGVRSITVRDTTRGDRSSTLVHGEAPPDEIVVREHGVPFVVDLERGQKTGAFLDQRDNRRRVGALARGRRVLNLFSYAGGFSIHAALGGATKCTSVDVAAAAHATAQRSFRQAGVDPIAHDFVTADVFGFLDRATARGDRWDLVVCDPPNMAPSEATRARAMASYRRLHKACAAVLAPGGILGAASCSSHVSPDDFLATLDDESIGRGDLRVVSIVGAGADHPVLAGFPEGRYLKFVVLR
jgi:23S rRNA (cytosine1962-C5)-methyltransferase